MSDILDDSMREQLAAALLGWGEDHGTQRGSGGTIDSTETGDDNGRGTRKTAPGLGHRQGQIRGVVMDSADEEDKLNDDIDADSVEGPNEISDGWSKRDVHQQARSIGTEQQAPLSRKEKALPPLPDEQPASSSPEPEMSCRISRFPFSHPCEVPELIPDQEDMSGTSSTPSAPAPATPSVTSEVFRPLSQLTSLDLELGRHLNPTSGSEAYFGQRKTSIRSTKTAESEALGIIQEEEGNTDENTDGVSLLTPTEASYNNSNSEGGDKKLFPGVDGSHCRSVSSLGSGSSSEWRPSHGNMATRKSVNFFSRIRNGGNRAEDPCLERRSLTPMQLATPPRAPDHHDDDPPAPVGAMPTLSPTNTLRTEVSTTTKFFHRIPWLGESQPKKPEAVFGVDLKESIRVAPMKIRISHKGRTTSYRTFPLSMYKCCEFIRRAGDADANIFSSPGNAYNVTNLQAIFSTPPSFGEQFQFEGTDYTVHDAARLILVYLESLPKPLISPSVVKSWILLARQEGAIEPPCPRVETGLDFWTEALNRLPTANRNLTKYLLTVFAEVLLGARGEINEADARQLASAVSRAMFHHDADGVVLDNKGKDQKKKPFRRNVQPTLALAFLIKKRGEYAMSLSKAAGEDASKRHSQMFLPSTREILEWKGGPR
ncbi:Rho GTPase activation protein [Thermothelomyces heterothallicus CBS 202.75]|uniref:Rho GTPase activation protein n=1 Tax=Thermothelomyces heterothallicus CBS 202.75 TaxID=1149848 RepID=UPI0037437EEA